jgi:ABC-type antimicrobial peptide transport system permease subunit
MACWRIWLVSAFRNSSYEWQSLGMTFLGIAVGAAGALAAGRVLVRVVEGMQPTALSTFALMIFVLVAAALAASFIPARRASRVDPISALRQE